MKYQTAKSIADNYKEGLKISEFFFVLLIIVGGLIAIFYNLQIGIVLALVGVVALFFLGKRARKRIAKDRKIIASHLQRRRFK